MSYLFLFSQDDTRDIFLDGIVARNRALNADIVVVQILPREQWKVDYTYLSLYTIVLVCLCLKLWHHLLKVFITGSILAPQDSKTHR